MLDAGLFLDQRCELIDGDLIDKRGQKPPHAAAIRRVFDCFWRLFEAGRVLVQAPIEVSSSDQEWNWPEPDLAVLTLAKPRIQPAASRGDELLVAMEVADTTVWCDSVTKRDLYARAGAPNIGS
jgi:hypothetical protein